MAGFCSGHLFTLNETKGRWANYFREKTSHCSARPRNFGTPQSEVSLAQPERFVPQGRKHVASKTATFKRTAFRTAGIPAGDLDFVSLRSAELQTD
jgi:hypothetical protein